eukprot:CAMPEP_0170170920 /NCGR_PEP_ID=MMETSP0040_2-20121228/3966_1 /TAXON_ID=641309 /ORGANISM="Lotharella oceanica, Strain CCMP622" /LENGTH=38 /DNA_ID= /DNA_START= /DNA_END= /DNA_ORIENTATION=
MASLFSQTVTVMYTSLYENLAQDKLPLATCAALNAGIV